VPAYCEVRRTVAAVPPFAKFLWTLVLTLCVVSARTGTTTQKCSMATALRVNFLDDTVAARCVDRE